MEEASGERTSRGDDRTSTAEQGGALDNKIPTISRLYAMWRVTRRATPMGASYTFNFDIFVLSWILGHMQNGKNQLNVQAAPLASSGMQLIVASCIANLFPIGFLTQISFAELSSKLNDNRDGINNARIQQLNAEISSRMKHVIAISAMTAPLALPLFFSESIFVNIFRQDPEVAAIASAILNSYFPVVILIQLRSGFEQLMFGTNHQIAAMWMALFTFIVGSGLVYLFANGKAFLPNLEYLGIPIGFGVDALLVCFINGFYLAFHKDFKNFHFFRDLFKWNSNDWHQIKNILYFGLPILGVFLVEFGAAAVMAYLMGIIGDNQQAALNFTATLTSLASIPIIALGMATQLEMCAELPAKKWGNATRIARYGLLTSVLTIGALTIPPAFYPQSLTYLLTSVKLSPEILSYLKTATPLTAASLVCYASNFSIINMLRAAGDPILPTVNNVVVTGTAVLAQIVLALFTNAGIYGQYVALLMAMALIAALLVDRWIPRTRPDGFERNAQLQGRGAAAQPSGRVSFLSNLANCMPALVREGVFGCSNSSDLERQNLLTNPAPGDPQQLPNTDISPRVPL